MEPRPPAPSDPAPPPLAEAVPEIGETTSRTNTAAGGPSATALAGPPREPQPGDAIGPYRVVGELGRGGMAVVYRAEEAELSRHVALKVLLPATAAADPQAKARFVREARAQAKFTHDHVVTIYRVGEDGGVSYIAMPLLTGQTLAAALHANRRPPVAEVLRIGGEIAEGLAAAHAAGLVHRDIKPANVWLEGTRRWVKVLDFGLARTPEATDAQLTLAGRVVGTPAYMSPEQARGAAVDHRTDLFSLGVVLYQMATGHKPFTGEAGINVMVAILTAEPAPPRALAPDVPPALEGLILRLLAKAPAARPPTAAHVVAELEAIRLAVTAPPVAVVSLPAAAPAAANPWADIETTEPDEAPAPAPPPKSVRPARPAREAEADAAPRRPAKRPAPERDDRAPRSVKWVWVAGGGLGLLLLGGLVWLAVTAAFPKKPEAKDRPVAQPAAPPKPPPVVVPVVADDRAAAEVLIKKAKLRLQIDDLREHEVGANGTLPAGRITIKEIDFEDDLTLNGFYVTGTFLPALSGLKSLTAVLMNKWQMRLNVDHVQQLAAMPLANTLKRLDGLAELTPVSVTELKKFKALEDASFYAPAADDVLLGRLAQALPSLEALALFSVEARDELTDAGWEAVGKLPLTAFTMVKCPSAPDALRVLSAKGTVARPGVPKLEFHLCPRIDDDALRDLSARPTDLRILVFRDGAITDAGLTHLVGVKSLKVLDLKLCKGVTEAGVNALSSARPVRILWDDKILEPKKKAP